MFYQPIIKITVIAFGNFTINEGRRFLTTGALSAGIFATPTKYAKISSSIMFVLMSVHAHAKEPFTYCIQNSQHLDTIAL